MLIVPYLIYFSISKWTYPMKDYIGESGCFFLTFSRGMYQYEVQLSSFFMVFFRYICLFHGKCLQRIKLTPYVSFIYRLFRKNLNDKWAFYDHFWPFYVNPMDIFHKAEAQTVILRCLTSSNLNWCQSYGSKCKYFHFWFFTIL